MSFSHNILYCLLQRQGGQKHLEAVCLQFVYLYAHCL